MAEVFGAVGTAISLLDLILKRTRTIYRFKKDAEGAVAEVSRLSQDLERRTELLRDLHAEFNGLDFRGSSMAFRCLEACENEIRELKTIVTLFELRLADGRSWWTLFTTKLELAWKKEDVKELHKNISSANEILADALRACQLYLAKASFEEVRLIRTKALPEATRTISASNASEALNILRALSFEAQNTRGTVIESGWTTTTEIRNLETSIGQMLVSDRASMQANLLPPLKQHMEGLAENSIQEMRTALNRVTSSTDAQPRSSASSSTRGQSENSSALTLTAERHLQTKRTAAVHWERQLPVGLGTISFRRETRQRILLRIRRYITEEDSSVDTETIYTLSFRPRTSIFGDRLTGCNWKYSFKTSRRLDFNHPVWDAIRHGNIDAMIEYFKAGVVQINDVLKSGGDSLLHNAARHQNYELCKWLVDNGADPHATNDSLQTALWTLQGFHLNQRPTQFYDQLLNLLVEECHLDPNDVDHKGDSILDSKVHGFDSGEAFGRILRLSMPLSTEPEGYRIKALFHSLADSDNVSRTILMRLKYLIEEYTRLRLPKDDADGRTWWYTMDFLKLLVGVTVEEGDPELHGVDREWVQEQIRQIMSSGIDLHSKTSNETMIDYILGIEARGNLRDDDRENIFVTWLWTLFNQGNVNLADYFREEVRLHRGGELQEHSKHYYLEYPIFKVRMNESAGIIKITRGIVVLDPESVIAMPGTWRHDSEAEYCEQHGLELCYREVLEDPKDPDHWPWCGSYLVGIQENPHYSFVDSTILDWILQDGRKGKMYPLWTISTASFSTRTAPLEDALIFDRDWEKHPIWVEYPTGVVALIPHTWIVEEPPETSDSSVASSSSSTPRPGTLGVGAAVAETGSHILTATSRYEVPSDGLQKRANRRNSM